MSFTVNFNETKDVWDDFVMKSPQYSIFINSHFLDSLQNPYQLITLYDGAKITSGAVFFLDKNGMALKHPMPYTQFQGLVFADAGDEPLHSVYHHQLEVLEFFLPVLKEKFGHFYLSQSWKFGDIRGFSWFNYHTPEQGVFNVKVRYTPILELSQVNKTEVYLKDIRRNRRREYNNAIKDGYTIEDSNDIHLLNNLHNYTFQRNNLTVPEDEQKLLLSISDSAIKNGYGEIRACKSRKGEFATASLFLYDGNYGYYLFVGDHPDHRNSGSTTLLLIDSIYRCKEKGLKYVDFVGANSPNRSDYKISFNAIPRSYFELSI